MRSGDEAKLITCGKTIDNWERKTNKNASEQTHMDVSFDVSFYRKDGCRFE